MASCPFCDGPLSEGPPWAPGPGYRLAYDPVRGRLWEVCLRCARWVLTPIESRWEVLEACEAAVQSRGEIRFSTPHLSLVDVGGGELIRVGRSPRPEFVDWRYGPRLVTGPPSTGFWARVLSSLPSPPVGGYDPYQGFWGALSSAPWLASPFVHAASSLTYLFSQVPLAPTCPSCRRPLALRPWDFQGIRFVRVGPEPELQVTCALCGDTVDLAVDHARPGLRLGLAVVISPNDLRDLAGKAARALESFGGPAGLLWRLSGSGAALGELDSSLRSALLISLDEMAEAEALEAEWAKAEELASIMDGELSQVPGFEAFRRRILDPDRLDE